MWRDHSVRDNSDIAQYSSFALMRNEIVYQASHATCGVCLWCMCGDSHISPCTFSHHFFRSSVEIRALNIWAGVLINISLYLVEGGNGFIFITMLGVARYDIDRVPLIFRVARLSF